MTTNKIVKENELQHIVARSPEGSAIATWDGFGRINVYMPYGKDWRHVSTEVLEGAFHRDAVIKAKAKALLAALVPPLF